eukprot:2257711-Rhodomonas_salina.1
MLLRTSYAMSGTELGYAPMPSPVEAGHKDVLAYVHQVLCPTPYVLRPTSYVLCPVPYAIRIMPYAIYPLPYAVKLIGPTVCTTAYIIYPTPYAMPYDLHPLP